jgi:hypothetical protein
MPESKAPPVAIVDFRAEQYSPDGKAIVVSFATTESAERRSYALPVQSLYGFIADLQKLPAASQAAQTAAAPSAPPPPPVSSPARPTPTHVEVTVPRAWMARAMPERNVVVMLANYITPFRGFEYGTVLAKLEPFLTANRSRQEARARLRLTVLAPRRAMARLQAGCWSGLRAPPAIRRAATRRRAGVHRASVAPEAPVRQPDSASHRARPARRAARPALGSRAASAPRPARVQAAAEGPALRWIRRGQGLERMSPRRAAQAVPGRRSVRSPRGAR